MTKKIGLVLEGGGMRGLYTAGVLDFLHDKGIRFRYIIGVSAGACNAASYISRQRGRNLQINTTYCADKRYLNLAGVLTRGSVFGMDFLFHEIPDKILPFDYDTFLSSDSDFYVVSTDCETGKPHYVNVKGRRNCNDYIMASSSLPCLSPIVELDGKKLMDGGASDSIPVKRALSDGNDKLVVVLTRNDGYQKKKSKMNTVYKLKYPKYKGFVHTLCRRYQNYNDTLAFCKQLEKDRKALILRPSRPVEVGRLEKDPEKLRALYQNGYEDAEAVYRRLLDFMADCDNVEISID